MFSSSNITFLKVCRIKKNSLIIFFQISGDSTVVWKQGNRVIFADRVHIGKDLRASIVDNTSLVLTGVDTQYTGNSFYIKLLDTLPVLLGRTV